ncbi:MAG: hypothetical protein AAGA11_10255 [Pseudomonadota bacterium]
MDGSVLAFSALCVACVVHGGCYVARRLLLRAAVTDGWDLLSRALHNRHDMLDSVRRIVRRDGLEQSLGFHAVTEAQSAAREALKGDDFQRIVGAEHRLGARLEAVMALIADHRSPDTDAGAGGLDDLHACLTVANTAVDIAALRYNTAVERNNAEVNAARFDWIVAFSGPAYALAFRPAGQRIETDEPYVLIA